MTAEPPVTVVICAHTMERLDDLRAAIESVWAQERPPAELLVVIDHNTELQTAIADVERGAPVPTTVMANAGPKGLSGGRNTGTEAARGEVVAYLDDDAVARPDWLRHLAAPFDDPTVAAVGGWAVPAWDVAAPSWFPDEFAWVIGCSHRGLPTELTEVRNVIGCNMAFRRGPVLDAGGFETGLGRTADRPLGCEETELCIRLRQRDAGAVLLLEPAAVVQHRVPESRGRWRYFFSRCRAEGNSKAAVARLVGSGDGLSSERAYVRRVLPGAVLDAMIRMPHAPATSAGRMLAIVGGLAVTTGGYLEHSLRQRV